VVAVIRITLYMFRTVFPSCLLASRQQYLSDIYLLLYVQI
jgi:hypothetical protein